MATAVVSFQWFFWGYSLAFSHTAGKFIGNLDNIGFRNVLAAPSVGSSKIPDLLFAVYQGMFAAITVALAIGAVAERGRMLPAVVFMFVWSTVIYDPIACWTWNSSGWVFKMGGLDFAGGTPVHISSGCAALAYSIMLGKRRGHGVSPPIPPCRTKLTGDTDSRAQLSSPQRHTHCHRHRLPLGWLVWIQRRFGPRCQHARCHGRCRNQPGCLRRRHHLVSP
jgi:ammonia channel protein AmtB